MSSEGAGNLYFIGSITTPGSYCDIWDELLRYFEEHTPLCLTQFGQGTEFQHDNYSKHAAKMTTPLFKRNMVKISFL